jgi:hypothetical protein
MDLSKADWEVVFTGTDEEWEAERRRSVCLAQPSRYSTARCEMRKGHDSDDPYEGTSPEAAEFLASFHAGRTRGGYWKFWAAEKPVKEGEGNG